MRSTFGVSAVLASLGILLAVAGILQNEGKLFGIGFVLMCGSGLFAMLFLGTRLRSANRTGHDFAPAVLPEDDYEEIGQPMNPIEPTSTDRYN